VKILLISYNVRRRGGIERLSLDVAAGLTAQGHQVQLLCTRRLGPGPLGRLLSQLWFLLRLCLASRRCELLWSMHALLLHQVQAVLPATLPKVCWLHGVEVWGSALPPLTPSLRRCRALAASSNFTRQRLLEQPGPWPRIEVIHPLARLWDGQHLPAALAKEQSELRLLTVARMDNSERYKGHELIMQALPKFDRFNWHWRVIGGGNDLSRLQTLSRSNGLAERVNFMGSCTDAELREAYGWCNLLAMPSGYGLRADGSACGEGFGITYLEAALAGRASLACMQGGQNDLIINGQSGWLVEANPASVLAALQAIAENPQQLAQRGAAARQRAESCFGGKRLSASLNMLLQQIS
jgi:glycosyltransferase involved in cell wall biosynthesis